MSTVDYSNNWRRKRSANNNDEPSKADVSSNWRSNRDDLTTDAVSNRTNRKNNNAKKQNMKPSQEQFSWDDPDERHPSRGHTKVSTVNDWNEFSKKNAQQFTPNNNQWNDNWTERPTSEKTVKKTWQTEITWDPNMNVVNDKFSNETCEYEKIAFY